MLKKAITIILALAMMSGTSVFASNETEESNNATQIEQSSEVTAFESDISRAVSLGIINNENYNFNDDITREQFCNFVYNLVNPIKELPIFKYERAPFDDTNGNDKITVLYSAKIVSGKGDYIFSPNDKLTREEAATILCRAANYLDIELPLAKVDMSYADNSEISSWAVSFVYSLKTLNILNNTDENFNPKANITISQAVSALVRLYDKNRQVIIRPNLSRNIILILHQITKYSCLFYTNPFFVFVLLLQFFFACKKYIDALHKAVLFLAHVEFKEMGEHETKGEFYEKRITT